MIVDHVYYWTRDMERALAFYTDVVGLELLRREGDEWAELEAARCGSRCTGPTRTSR